ncbi:MAG: hypothetical protein KDE27_32125 [Planctomycetes bacterium]|nr:hypothetical protein [Planctomycetota bacterium]
MEPLPSDADELARLRAEIARLELRLDRSERARADLTTQTQHLVERLALALREVWAARDERAARADAADR